MSGGGGEMAKRCYAIMEKRGYPPKEVYTLADAKWVIEKLIVNFGPDAQVIGEVRARAWVENAQLRGFSESEIWRWPARGKRSKD